MEGANNRIRRSKLLSGFVEIMAEVPDLASARDGADELARIADEVRADFMKGLATGAEGAVLLAEGKAKESLRPLRASLEIWNGLDAPYEASRTRVLIAKACESLGDLETCAMEIQAARAIFQRLGAEPDLTAIGSLGGSKAHSELGLTGRELEVLALVATGKTNRVIAEELFIAEKTVARHISNIFTKLDVSSRTEATAYAYEHGLA
jgi:DNA-binding CsgD family transcriptional regulator